MALLQVAEVAGRRHVLEVAAARVAEHPVGDERAHVGIAGAQVDVEPAVVVEVAEVETHAQHDPVQTGNQ